MTQLLQGLRLELDAPISSREAVDLIRIRTAEGLVGCLSSEDKSGQAYSCSEPRAGGAGDTSRF